MDTSNFQRSPEIRGETSEETSDLRAMANEGCDFIQAFKWCPKIDHLYLAYAVAGVVALLLVEFSKKIAGTDDKLWVVVGDLPSAYLVVEPDDSPAEALERYCLMMDDWINAVRQGGPLTEVFPVRAKPTDENAAALQGRMEFLRSEIIPQINIESDASGHSQG